MSAVPTSPPRRGRRFSTAVGRFLPRGRDYAALRRSWRGDLVAGVTVGVVALPLALGFGITTGLGAAAGITTAIVAGIVAGVFGGSNVQVSGPTGAMTVVLVPIVAQYGKSAVLVVGILAGVLIVAAAFFRLGRLLAYIPWPVVEGFTIGIAVIIFLQQVPAALGVTKPDGENTAIVAGRAVGAAWGNGSLAALAIVFAVAAIMALTPRLHSAIPGSLVAVVVTTVAAQLGHLDVARIGHLPGSLASPALPTISFQQVQNLAGTAFAIAALAAIESLLSARVADGMVDTSPHDPDRELFGQGLANIVSPLFGGMPATGAIARTAVNIRAGARTRVAALTHSVVLVFIVFFAGSFVAKIPLAALAGVLMVTAVRMVDVHNVRAVLRSTRADALVLALTAIATIVFDLVVAVEIGVAVAAVLALRAVSQASGTEASVLDATEPAITPDDEIKLMHDHIVVYRLDGAFFFGVAQRFLSELTAVGDVRVAILRLRDVRVLDATGAQALGEIILTLERRGITVLLQGVRVDQLRLLRAVGSVDRLAHENHLFADLDAALVHAREHVERATSS